MTVTLETRKRRRAAAKTGLLPNASNMDVDGDVRLEEHDSDLDLDISSDDDEPRAKRAMRIRSSMRLLEQLPALQQYQRDRFGRRGAVDSGSLGGESMVNALGNLMADTSVNVGIAPMSAPAVLMQPEVAMVAPVTLAATAPRRNAGRSEVHNMRTLVDGRVTARGAALVTKDDEARPAST